LLGNVENQQIDLLLLNILCDMFVSK
jgi:hypothetical protein